MKWVKEPSYHFFEVLQHCQGARKKLHLTFFVLLRLGTNMLMCMCKICLTHLKANFHSLNVQRSLISDRQSLISIAERLGEAKTTAEHNLNSEC